jgi:hypothetical protein
MINKKAMYTFCSNNKTVEVTLVEKKNGSGHGDYKAPQGHVPVTHSFGIPAYVPSSVFT